MNYLQFCGRYLTGTVPPDLQFQCIDVPLEGIDALNTMLVFVGDILLLYEIVTLLVFTDIELTACPVMSVAVGIPIEALLEGNLPCTE